jgi:hypothetical protein
LYNTIHVFKLAIVSTCMSLFVKEQNGFWLNCSDQNSNSCRPSILEYSTSVILSFGGITGSRPLKSEEISSGVLFSVIIYGMPALIAASTPNGEFSLPSLVKVLCSFFVMLSEMV